MRLATLTYLNVHLVVIKVIMPDERLPLTKG